MVPKELTDEQKEDIQKRAEEFKKRYAELREEFQMDFLSQPVYVPTERGTYETFPGISIVDLKYAPVPSPLAKS